MQKIPDKKDIIIDRKDLQTDLREMKECGKFSVAGSMENQRLLYGEHTQETE